MSAAASVVLTACVILHRNDWYSPLMLPTDVPPLLEALPEEDRLDSTDRYPSDFTLGAFGV